MYQGTVEDHRKLLQVCYKVVDRLTNDYRIQNVAKMILLHPDLHKRNIYVLDEDPSKITCLIDWQGTVIEPTIMSANETPDLCNLPDEILANCSVNGKPNIDAEDAKYKKILTDVSICQQTYDVRLRVWAPTLYEARTMDQTLSRIFRYCASSWRDSLTALRAELVALSER